MYSKIILIIQTTAKINDPNASDPELYLKLHQKPVEREKSPL